MTDFAWLPANLAGELQQGFLERELEEGLDSVLAYRATALVETIPARIGETLTRTRKGRKTPTRTPLPVSAINALDNGMNPTSYAIEQYQFTLMNYADTVDVDLLGTEATIGDDFIANSRNNGVQAAQSRELIARYKLFSAYLGANTRVRTDLGNSTTTSCHVDDVRGFLNTWVNGVITPISTSNPITVQEYAVGGTGVTQTLTVTAVTPDGTNFSSSPDGMSGVLTFNTAQAPVNGDALVASFAPSIKRPAGHLTTAQMTIQDALTLGLLQDAVASLRANAVPPMADGTYHVILDDISHRQIMADQDFKVYYASRQDSTAIKRQDVYVMLGMTFIPTTNAYVQLPATDAGGGSGGTGVSQVTTTVRRPIVLGAECLIEGNFEGLETFLTRQGVSPIADTMMVDNVLQVVRPPIDRLNQFASLSWHWVGDYAVPTDVTATTSIIPTASNAAWKRAVIVEHAG